MTRVDDEISKLRFSPGPLQSLYLNYDRVNERFVSHLGAITQWTRSAEKQGGGGVDLSIVKANAEVKAANVITYGVEDPVVRALLLREALVASGDVQPIESATEGQYVIETGRACLRHPALEQTHAEGLHAECVPANDPRIRAIEVDRSRAEGMLSALAGSPASIDRMWLLILTEGDRILSGAVLNSHWINDAVVSYPHKDWTIFGTVREVMTGIPVLAAIHVWASWGTGSRASTNAG